MTMEDNNEYKTCPDCCYDILDDEGDVMDHECISDNEMIAEFMGDLKIANDEDKRDYLEYCVHYDISWDWLMPVIESIDHLQHEPIQGIEDALATRHIGDAYKAVVEFIKQYNESNKMDTLPTSVQQG